MEFTPLFANTTNSQYKVIYSGRTVTCKTRNVSSVQTGGKAANGLFADNLWPGCFVMADIIACNPHICLHKTVLELGAGAALPSVVAGVLGASKVVVTDYPEQSVIENIEEVMRMNSIEQAIVISHLWGDSVDELRKCVEGAFFDVLILAEVLWKDTYHLHDQLLQSISQTLNRQNGLAFMTFVHRETDTHKAENDLEFFSVATAKYGLRSKCLGQSVKYRDVFEDTDSKAVVNVYMLYYNADYDLYEIDGLSP